MTHEKIYNMIRSICGSLLLVTLFMMPSCEDDRVADETPQELIQMWLDGNEIPVYDYYESVTTYGVKTLTDSGDVKKVFVIHFQKEFGRVTPEKEHYALIMYDIDGIDNDDLIDEGSYVNPASLSTKGVTLEIVGLSDYTSNAQGAITRNEDNVVDGVVEGTFYNPYAETMQNVASVNQINQKNMQNKGPKTRRRCLKYNRSRFLHYLSKQKSKVRSKKLNF